MRNMRVVRRRCEVGMQYDPSPGPPWCGWGRRVRVPRWESWAVLAGCLVAVLLGWLVGR